MGKRLIIFVLLICVFTVGYFVSQNINLGEKEGNGEIKNETIEEVIPVTRISYNLDAPEGFPAIYQWENGGLWYIFKMKDDNGVTDVYFVPSSDDGKTWKIDLTTKITDNAINDEHNTIAEIDGKVLLAWDDGRQIHSIFSKDQGKTWEKINLGLDNDYYPFLFKKSENELWLLYISKKEGNGGVIKYITSSDGINWSEPHMIVKNSDIEGISEVYGNAIMYKIDGKLWLMWDTGAELDIMSDLLYSVSEDGGKTWSETAKLTATPNEDEVDPFICTQSNGKKLLVYASAPKGTNEKYFDFGTGEPYNISYVCYENGEWSTAKQFSKNVNTEYLEWYPTCFKTNKGTMLLGFASDRNDPELTHIGGREVYVARFEDVC